MFSTEARCIYRNNQLAEVICQLRFPEILTIETEIPAKFQDAIRSEFPRYSVRKEAPAPKLTGTPGNFRMENQAQKNNYQFVSADGAWRVNLTSTFISLACCRYTGWEDFAAKLDKPLAAFIQLYRPAFFERIGLRYLNFISRNALNLEGIPFRELMQSQYLGLLADDEINEQSTTRNAVDADLGVRGGCRAKIHAGPGMVTKNGQSDKEIKFVFDLDLYMPGNVAVNLSAGALQTLHGQAFPIFRGAITDTLHDALEPEQV
jgi:uncharacterized protein (TIGR04255 family)